LVSCQLSEGCDVLPVSQFEADAPSGLLIKYAGLCKVQIVSFIILHSYIMKILQLWC